MDANYFSFSTNLGTRIHSLATSISFEGRTFNDVDVEIYLVFYNHEYLVSSDNERTKIYSKHIKGEFSEELASDARRWSNKEWSAFLDEFKDSHQGLLPNVIIAEFHTGYAMTHKHFVVSFHPCGRILYAEVDTNEGSVRWDGYFNYKSRVRRKDEARINTLLELDRYIKEHQNPPSH